MIPIPRYEAILRRIAMCFASVQSVFERKKLIRLAQLHNPEYCSHLKVGAR